jgi:glycosyltransferase involved in cell wall biosynthesis
MGPVLLHRLRRAAGIAFLISAWAKHGRARKPGRPRPGPVCVVGFHGSVVGIGEAARAFSAALRAAGAEVIDWDISARFGHRVWLDGAYSAEPPEEAGAMVIFLNPLELVQLVAMTGAAPFDERFCVGAWAWELQAAPEAWRQGFRYVDEVWACSRFVADSLAALAPKGLVVRVLHHAVCPPPPLPQAPIPPEGKAMVLVAFDARSGFARKNPIAAVRAFRRANTAGQAVLVCKAMGAEGAPELMAQLHDEIGEGEDARLVTDWLTSAQMAGLVSAADVVLSLHRSEGFGLVLAHAMAAGKPVVATGWSGNMDFMSDQDSVLVDYALIPVSDPQGLYDGGVWAEPDIDDAAAKLAALLEDPERRHAIGDKAAAAIARTLNPKDIGLQARAWLGHDVPAEP